MKMMILSGMAAGLFVILAFALGVVIGTRFCCPFSRENGRSRKLPDGCFGCCCEPPEKGDPVVKAESDPEKQRQYEENQKAFEDCMNYSAVQAYERKGVNRHGM